MGPAALAYAAHGWPVFPLRGKAPAKPKREGGRGYLDATTDPATVRAMWARYPGANVGIRTGEASGTAVLDVDPDKGGYTALCQLEAERGCLPGTLMQQTGGGGLHIVYRWQPGITIGSAVWGPGLDLRGEGGYIVAAPSIHPDTRQPYRWAGDGTWRHDLTAWPLRQLPIEKPARERSVVVPFRRPAVRGQGPLPGLVRVVLEAADGTRNDRLNWSAHTARGHIAAGHLDARKAAAALFLAAERVGLGTREIEATIASGLGLAGREEAAALIAAGLGWGAA